MADYQEYRRRILHRRWRRMFITAALLILLVLLAAVGVLWKRLHREPAPNTAQGPTILQQELTGSEWNTISYTPARRLSVQTLDNGMTAMDFRLAAQPASPAVERSSFSDVSFLGDSLTQGMQLYDTGLPNAHFCAYKGVGPNAVVNNTTCRRADGEKEVPMEALASQQPRALYILLGTNVLTADSDYTSFLTYYRLMLDMISQALPNTKIYVQSITPVRPEVIKKSPGLYKERLCEINDALSAIALEKGCTFLNLWEALADENGDLIDLFEESMPYDMNADIIDIDDVDYGIFYIDMEDNPKKYVGKTVRFKARAMKSRKEEAEYFVPGRKAMTCCADDTRVIGYICKTPLAKTLRHGQWVQVTAKVAFEYSKQYRGKGPVFYASEVVPCEAPAEEMVYFN